MTREDARDVAAKAAHAERRRRMEAAPLAPNLHSLVEEFCREDPEAAAWVFVDSNETLTRRDVFDRITRLASSLCRIGVGKGTHVAVTLPNVSAFPITWLALACLGAVMVPVNTRYTAAELGYVLNDAEAEFLVIDATLLAQFESVVDRPPVLTPDRIIVLGSGCNGVVREGHARLQTPVARWSRRFAEHPIHVGHHGLSQGGHADPALLADHGPRCGASRRAAAQAHPDCPAILLHGPAMAHADGDRATRYHIRRGAAQRHPLYGLGAPISNPLLHFSGARLSPTRARG